MGKWENRTGRGCSLQECYTRAMTEIMETYVADPESKEGIVFKEIVGGNLMGFVATRYAAAKGEKFEGEAETGYDECKEGLITAIRDFVTSDPEAYLKFAGRKPLLDSAGEAMAELLEGLIPEWVGGRQRGIGPPLF